MQLNCNNNTLEDITCKNNTSFNKGGDLFLVELK